MVSISERRKNPPSAGFVLPLLAILLPIVLYSIFRFAVGALVPTLESVFSLSSSNAGYLVSASLAGTGIGTALSGFSSPRIGEKNTALIGLLLFSIPLGTGALLGSSVFIALFVLSGLGTGLMTTPSYSIAATLLPKRKGTAVGFLSASYNLGGFIGPPLCGSFLNYYGWQYPFLGMSAMGIVISIVFVKGLSEYDSTQRNLRNTKSEEGHAMSRIRAISKNKNMLVLGLSMAFADFAFLSFASWTISYIQSRFDMAKSASSSLDLYFGIAVGLGGIGIIVGGMLNDRIGGRRTALVAGILSTALTLILYSIGTYLAAIVFLFAVGFFSNWFWGLLSAMAQANVPDDLRSSAVSFVQSVAFIGAVLGPGVAGFLLGSSNLTSLPMVLTVTVPFLAFTLAIGLAYKEPAPILKDVSGN